MGTGFWIIQATFVVAAIATAVSVEREHRRDERESARAPSRKIRIATPTRSMPQFTLLEQSRLMVLRALVQEARSRRGHWYDDLAPDPADPRGPYQGYSRGLLAMTPVPMPGDARGRVRRCRWSGRTLSLLAGVLLLTLGGAGIWRTNNQMDNVESAQRATIAVPKSSLTARLVPGVISYPAKYLGALNSSGSSSSGDPLLALAMLEQKQAMDRYEAVLGIGLALLVAGTAGWPGRPQPALSGDANAQQSSIGSDLVPFLLVAALLVGALSFFELA